MMRAEETTFRRRRLLIFVAAQHNPPFLEKVLSMGRARPRSFDREAHRNDAVEVWSGNLGRRSRLAASLFALVAIGLSGCADYGLRRGPSAVLDATSIETAASNQIAIVNALALDAGFESGTPVDYYRVTEAGFNYVDDQCRAYFDEMYFIDRARSQTKSGLAAASATTVAILGLANASTIESFDRGLRVRICVERHRYLGGHISLCSSPSHDPGPRQQAANRLSRCGGEREI